MLSSPSQGNKQALNPTRVAALVESFPTINYFIGFLTIVSFLVCDKGGALAEGFPTFITDIWLLSSVGSLMPNQGRPLAEGPSTDYTHRGSCQCESVHVG